MIPNVLSGKTGLLFRSFFQFRNVPEQRATLNFLKLSVFLLTNSLLHLRSRVKNWIKHEAKFLIIFRVTPRLLRDRNSLLLIDEKSEVIIQGCNLLNKNETQLG